MGKWTPEERMESRALLVKAGAALIMIGAALTYLLSIPALQRDVTLWSVLLAAPGGITLFLGIIAVLRGADLDLLPLAKHIVDRIGKDAPQ